MKNIIVMLTALTLAACSVGPEKKDAAATYDLGASPAAAANQPVLAEPHADETRRNPELLRQHVTGLVPDDAVESSVELFRAFTNGIVVNAVMDPVGWPASRQEALLDQAIGLILPNEGLPE